MKGNGFFSALNFRPPQSFHVPLLGFQRAVRIWGKKASDVIFFPHSGGKYIFTHFDALFSQAHV